MTRTAKKFIFGWEGDQGLGERLIQAILDGSKTATSGPASDLEDAGVEAGDLLQLTDKDGKARGFLEAVKIEFRPYDTFDEALAAREGTTLKELRDGTAFANDRPPGADEPMRVIHFRLQNPQ